MPDKVNKQLTTQFLDQSAGGAFITIPYEHYEIHKGGHYIGGYHEEGLAAEATIELYIIAPTGDSWAHVHFYAASTGTAIVTLYEAPTVSAVGTPAQYTNRNFNSDNTPESIIYHSPTVTDVGTMKTTDFIGSDRKIGGQARSAEEIVLKSGETYLVRAVSKVVDNTISIGMDWYEHGYIGI